MNGLLHQIMQLRQKQLSHGCIRQLKQYRLFHTAGLRMKHDEHKRTKELKKIFEVFRLGIIIIIPSGEGMLCRLQV